MTHHSHAGSIYIRCVHVDEKTTQASPTSEKTAEKSDRQILKKNVFSDFFRTPLALNFRITQSETGKKKKERERERERKRERERERERERRNNHTHTKSVRVRARINPVITVTGAFTQTLTLP